MVGSIEAARRLVRAATRNTRDGYGGLAELAALVELRDEVEVAIDAGALHLLANDDASYREVAVALGITRQAAMKRYPEASSRPQGGQPGNLR